MEPIRAQHPNRRGAMIILMVILMVVIVGMVAFAVEVGRMCILRSEVQNAVDAGALAAVLQLTENPNMGRWLPQGGSRYVSFLRYARD